MPPLPPWEGLHPLVVHFPIGVYLASIVLALAGAVFRGRRATWLWACVAMLAVATGGAFLATMTGEAAADIVGASSEALGQAVHEHEEAGELARNLFVVTLALGSGLALASSRPGPKRPLVLPLAVLFALAWAVGAVQLANAAHKGGVLVHVFGVHAPVGGPPPEHDDH